MPDAATPDADEHPEPTRSRAGGSALRGARRARDLGDRARREPRAPALRSRTGDADPFHRVGPLETELEALDGVESATVVVHDEYVADLPVPAPAVTVDLESHRTPEQAQATVDAAHVLLLAARLPGTPEMTVVDTVPGAGGSLTVAHSGAGDLAVRDAVALLDAGAASVVLRVDYASVEGRDVALLPALAETVRALGRALNSLSATGSATLLYSPAERLVPSVPAVALLAAAKARPETVQVVYEIRSPQGTPVPLLTVMVEGSPTPTADWLRGYSQGEALGTPVAFSVHGDETSESGFVAGRDTVLSDPAGDQADTAAAAADGVAPCIGADLRPAITGFDAALGARYLTVTAENVSGRACALDGRPGLSFLRASGTAPNVLLQPDRHDQNPTRIVVQPGATATSLLNWRAMSTANDTDVTTTVVVTTVPGAPPAHLPTATVDGISSGADILEGATVTVAPWVIPTNWPLTS